LAAILPAMASSLIKIVTFECGLTSVLSSGFGDKTRVSFLWADAAVHKHVITGKVEKSSVLMLANVRQLKCLVDKLRRMPYWGLNQIADEIKSVLEDREARTFVLTMPNGL